MDSNIPLIFLLMFFTLLASNSGHSHSHIIKSGCVETERRALLNFTKNLPFRNHTRLPSWVGDDCCGWELVTCSSKTGKIIGLDLSSVSYYGGALDGNVLLPLLSLHRLAYLDVSHNNFTGSKIPKFIGSFKSLQHLSLASSGFVGRIPGEIGNLSFLEELHLEDNSLIGQIPNISSLSCLQFLDISDNSLTGTLSDAHFSNLSMLTNLDISYNHFLSFKTKNDWIPPFKLQYLFTDFCQVGPKFPSWLRTQHSLQRLSLSNGGIQDHVPNWFLNFSSSLNRIDLSHNKLKGQLTQFLNPNFGYLDLSYNLLSGSIPAIFGEKMFQHLWYLDLSSNRFYGSIPLSFCELAEFLEFLIISNNKLSGELPNCLNFPSMIYLDLSSNNFHGKVPLLLCNMTYLKAVGLSKNYLTGDLPHCLANLASLVTLDLGHNKLTGNIPTWMGTKGLEIQLAILSLTSNALTGVIPNLSNLPYLQILDLSNNNFYGHIPPSLGNLTAMFDCPSMPPAYNLGLQSEHVYFYVGIISVPMWLTTKAKENEYGPKMLSMIAALDLSNNALSGHIPDELMQLHGLQTLNLSGNNLTGQIPVNIDRMQQIETLDLSRNNLFGTIPGSMGTLHFLEDLNLSYNNLSGRIPTNGQLESFDNSSIYEGNPYLCGFPIEKKCDGDDTNQQGFNDNDEVHGDGADDFFWFYLAIVPGFVVGFWLVWGTLIFAKNWRIAYFQAIDKFYYMLLERM